MGSRLIGYCIYNVSLLVVVVVRCFERKSYYGFFVTLFVVRWLKARYFVVIYRVRRE